MYIKDPKEISEGMRVEDKSWGQGTVSKVMKTRVKVKFDRREDEVTYDHSHIKICLTEIR